MRTSSRSAARALVVAAMAVTCACAPAVANDGPLLVGASDDGRPTRWTCGQGDPLGSVSTADVVAAENADGEPLKITRISLVDPDQMEFAGAYLWPEGEGKMPGIGGKYTSSREDQYGSAVGATIAPDFDGRLVLGVRASGAENSVKQFKVEYEMSSGREYYALTSGTFIVRDSCRDESPSDYGFDMGE